MARKGFSRFQKLLSIFSCLSIVVNALFYASALFAEKGGPQGKVQVCHMGHMLEIASQARDAHLAHGDTLGECTPSFTGGTQTSVTFSGSTFTGVTLSGNTTSGRSTPPPKKNIPKKPSPSVGKCEWIDEYGRPKREWHEDVSQGDDLELYKKCLGQKYTPDSPHPGCRKITQPRGNSTPTSSAPGFARKYYNCTNYGTPYPQYLVPNPDPDLRAIGSIMINNDTPFTETQNVILTLSASGTPTAMRLSSDGVNFSEWRGYESVVHFLIPSNTAGEKRVYVQYKYGTSLSPMESDGILLLPRYGATYSVANTANLPSVYELGKTYLFEIKAKNTGILTWKSNMSGASIDLTYRFGSGIEQKANIGFISGSVAYGETATIPILVRIPDNLSIGKNTLTFDLEDSGVLHFSEVHVTPLSLDIEVRAGAPVSRPGVTRLESLPFGVGGYTSVANEPTPSVVTVCKPKENLYSLSADQSVFTIQYSVPFGRSIHTPHIYNVWTDSSDPTLAFYELDYSEYVSDPNRYYLYRESAETSELCATEQQAFPNARPCESSYSDVSGVSDTMCLDLAKATSRLWVSGYDDGTYRPQNGMNRAEFSKLVTGAGNLPRIAYTGGMSDVSASDWFSEYASTAVHEGAMTLYPGSSFRPEAMVSYLEAVTSAMKTFRFNISNGCNYSLVAPGDPYLGAALFYGIIGKNDIPTDSSVTPVTRMQAVSMMVVAESQQTALSSPSPICPQSPDDRYLPIIPPLEPKEIPALKTPSSTQVVVSSPAGIYAFTFPSAIAPFFDYNGDTVGNTMDIIPYNTLFEVKRALGNWYEVEFLEGIQAGKRAWIFAGFVVTGSGVPTAPQSEKKLATVDWAHGMTVDLRSTPLVSNTNIIWEVYEGATVEILEDTPTSPFVFVRVVNTAKNITPETFILNYARLYPNFITSSYPINTGIAGYIHRDFLREINKVYTTPFIFPFKNIDSQGSLVTNIFLEEVFQTKNEPILHDGIDYNLTTGTIIYTAGDGIIGEIGKDYIIVDHPTLEMSTIYGHIVPSSALKLGQTVKKGVTILGFVEGNPILGSGKPHLHFSITDYKKGDNFMYNPTKYIKGYSIYDANICVRQFIIDGGMRNGDYIASNCNAGIGGIFQYSNMLCNKDTLFLDPIKGFICIQSKQTGPIMCKLGSKYYKAPSNSHCVTNDINNAWGCDVGYIQKQNSCIPYVKSETSNDSYKYQFVPIEGSVLNGENGSNIFMKASETIFQGAYSSLITLISSEVSTYGFNAPIIFSIIYEEQSHLLPPIIEDSFGGASIGLSQILAPTLPTDKEYFGYNDSSMNELLNYKTHISIMNTRINLIKKKITEEGKIITPENIGRAWNGGMQCVKKGGACSSHAIEYGKRIQYNYPYFQSYYKLILLSINNK